MRQRLILPETFEELTTELGEELMKMMQFVIPVEQAERDLAMITSSIRHSGRLVFLLGEVGIGKSTFLRSLTWRKFLPIPSIEEIDANTLGPSSVRLERLYELITKYVTEKKRINNGLPTIIVNYFEDFAGQSEEAIRGFFRDLNGLLRRHPVLIIWPATIIEEINRIISIVENVSDTMFARQPILKFTGPSLEKFPIIAKNTISTLNDGLSIMDFQLSDNDFEEILQEFEQLHSSEHTIRNYLRRVRQEWEIRTDEVSEIMKAIPKPTEIWFVVCYPSYPFRPGE